MMINYIELYTTHCSELYRGYTKKDVKAHNVAMKELAKIFHLAKKESDKSFFCELMHDSSNNVRLIAAAHCLGMNEFTDEAQKILRAITRDTTNSELAFEAQATLDVWKRQGYLQF